MYHMLLEIIKVGGNDIKASDGTTAITLAGNDVTVADDLTVSGNLYVNGSTTQVNTAALVSRRQND
jgi:uncharacterized protein with beta-barrel porin domain